MSHSVLVQFGDPPLRSEPGPDVAIRSGLLLFLGTLPTTFPEDGYGQGPEEKRASV